MRRKFLLFIIFLLLLSACTKKQEHEEILPEEDTVTDLYIDPVKDVFIFGELQDEKLKEKIRAANCHSDFANYQFKMLGKGVYEGRLEDIHICR